MKFEIDDNKIRQIHTNIPIDEDYICEFQFNTNKWKHKEKYVIFWDERNQNTIKTLGHRMKTTCSIPESIKTSKKFVIQIYVDEELYTNKLTVQNYCKPREQQEEESEEDKKNREWKEILEAIKNKYDKVLYKDNKLRFYANKELLTVIDIVDEDLIKKIIAKEAPEYITDLVLSPNSTNPVANKIIYEALLTKVNIQDLPTVALTGNYNDLKNIPTEFNPTHHNHIVVDVVDYEENIDIDLNTLLDILSDEITKE